MGYGTATLYANHWAACVGGLIHFRSSCFVVSLSAGITQLKQNHVVELYWPSRLAQ